jgi:hypothetical protein
MKKSSSEIVRRVLPLRSTKRRAQRDQRRRRVADRRAIGDVAADGTGIAHLLAADTVHQLAELRRDVLRSCVSNASDLGDAMAPKVAHCRP